MCLFTHNHTHARAHAHAHAHAHALAQMAFTHSLTFKSQELLCTRIPIYTYICIYIYI